MSDLKSPPRIFPRQTDLRSTRLIGRCARAPNHGRPPFDVLTHECRKFGGRQSGRIGALARKLIAHPRILERVDHRLIEFADNFVRKLRWPEYPEPRLGLETRNDLANRRKIRK